jgi:hypothetical protein
MWCTPYPDMNDAERKGQDVGCITEPNYHRVPKKLWLGFGTLCSESKRNNVSFFMDGTNPQYRSSDS